MVTVVCMDNGESIFQFSVCVWHNYRIVVPLSPWASDYLRDNRLAQELMGAGTPGTHNEVKEI